MSHNDQWSDREIRAAFFKMAATLGLWVTWLMITILVGAGKDWAFFDKGIQPWQHIAFYAWFVLTLPVVIWLTVRKIWKG
jgi:hypothetical protein